MKRKNTTRSALFTSIISLLLCVSMLVGTTFAWFTDEVVSGKNQIIAGNLDVELYHGKGEPAAKVEGASNLFTDEEGKDILWEPGVVSYTNLKVVNEGTLALKYQLSINFTNENYVEKDGVQYKLSQVLKVAVVPGGVTKTAREDVLEEAGEGVLLADFVKSGALLPTDASHIEEVNKPTGAKSVSETYGIVIYWEPSDLDNNWNVNNGAQVSDVEETGKNELHIDLGVKLVATQVEAEDDSFDHTYDENAWADGMVVTTVDELVTVLSNGGKAKLANDITVSASVEVPAGVAVELDLNGNALTSTPGWGEFGLTVNGSLTIDGEGDFTLQPAQFVGMGIKVTENGSLTINDGNFTMSGISGIFASVDGEITVNGGDFTGNKVTSLFNTGDTAKVTITGGKFLYGPVEKRENDTRTISISGGVFGAEPAEEWLAEGYATVANGDVYYVVPENVDGVIATPEDLATVLAGAADAGSGDNTIVIVGDIDLTGTTWKPIKVDGYNGAGVVTVEGNGHTITGLSAPLFEGGFAGKSGIVIKDLTVADSTVTGGTQGGGAFIDCADSMHVITLENCHVVNSTVSGERAGGLIGWCSGYAKQDDGPVKAYVTITNCSVVDSTVIGNGSAGGIAGHPGASDYTWTTIKDCIVKNVDVVSYEPIESWRTGAIVGTANNGHVVISNVTVEDVTLTQDGVTAESTLLYGRFVPSGTGTLVIDGASVVASNEALAEALTNGGEIILDSDLTWGDGARKNEMVVGPNTVINGNGHTITIDNDYRNFIMSEDGSKLVLNNVKLDTDWTAGTWDSYNICFVSDVEMNDVEFLQSIAFDRGADAVLTNVTITEKTNTSGTYALWISAEGSEITLNNVVIDAAVGGDHRAIKIDPEYCEPAVATVLNINGLKVSSDKKAAVLVKSEATVNVTGEIDISGVSADKTNLVWIDSNIAEGTNVTVTGANCIEEP